MTYTTSIIDKIKLERIIEKTERLTKKYDCSKVDLIVMSLQVHRANKKK